MKKNIYTYAVTGEIVEEVAIVASSRREADEKIYDAAVNKLLYIDKWPTIHSMVLTDVSYGETEDL